MWTEWQATQAKMAENGHKHMHFVPMFASDTITWAFFLQIALSISGVMEQLEQGGGNRKPGQIVEEQSPHGNFHSSLITLTLGPRPPS
jgi:hypothetical protein